MEAPDISLHLVGEHDPVNDPADFARWLSDNLACGWPIAIDTETTGLKWWTPRFTRLVQFGVADSGWAIPVEWYGRLVTWAMEQIRDAGVPVVMHNASFDMHALEGDGFPVPDWRNVRDTMVMHHLLHPHESHALKTLAKKMLGPWAGAGQGALSAAKKANGWGWDTIPVDEPSYWGYGVMDTILTRLVHDELKPALDSPAFAVESAYQAIMYRAECRGMAIDREYTANLLATWEERTADLRGELHDLGVRNPNSNRQVEDALVAGGWVPSEFTETGQARLDKVVLAELAKLDISADLATKLVEYKRLVKWSSTYLKTFLDDADANGRVHASVKTLGARTGRSSITNPPLQTLPHTPHIRNCVVPYSEDEQLYAIDYDGQEARLFAAYSREPEMLRCFREGDGDIHTLVAEMVGIERPAAKVMNFLILYGGGPGKLAQSLGVTRSEGEAMYSAYHQTFAKASDFMRSVETVGRARLQNEGRAYVTTHGKRDVVADADKTYSLLNYLIQGSGADVLKQAVCRLDAAGLADYIVVPVHDEVLFSFPTDEPELPAQAAELMADSVRGVPLTVGVDGPLERWGQKYEPKEGS